MPKVASLQESPGLDIPLISKNRVRQGWFFIFQWVLLIVLASSQAHLTPGIWLSYLQFFLWWGMLAAMGVMLASTLRYRRTRLVLDPEGIWLVKDVSRLGLRWEAVSGYERPKGSFVILGNHGERFVLPGHFYLDFSDRAEEIVRTLDRRIGPDGDRPSIPRPIDPVQAKLHDYYGQVPAVELEPGVVYRNGHRETLRGIARAHRIHATVVGLAAIVLLVFCRRLPFVSWPVLLLTIAFAINATWFFLAAHLANLRAEDRFVSRNGHLYRIRNGQEKLLPPKQSDSPGNLLGQPKTRFGRGPFAYEISMQFLEPDV